MGKKKRASSDRSIQIGQDATRNIIVSGDYNVVTVGELREESSMPAGCDVPKVFISSTVEDLKQYREAARDAAIAAGILPVQMEYFVASAQHAPLEACLRKVAETDVAVLIVAYRYGWVPTDQDGEQAKSITWLECERARADGREVLAFVVDEEHAWEDRWKEEHRLGAAIKEGKPPEQMAALLSEVQRNVQRLSDFKAWINSIGIRARFTTAEDLGWKVAEALRDWKLRHAGSSKRSGEEVVGTAPPPPTFPPLYREWLRQQCANIDLLGVRVRQGQAVKLNHIYVPLTTTPAQEAPPEGKAKPKSKRSRAEQLEGREKPCLLLEQLDQHSLYVPGDPGSGKSTFCRWVAWLVTAGSMPEGDVPVSKDYAEQFPKSLAPRLPVLFRLRDAWHCLPPGAGRETLSKVEFESALAGFLDNDGITGLDWACVAAHLECGTALLIFDGVDEVPLRIGEGQQAYYPRAMLLSGLTAAAAAWQRKKNRVLITSRPYGIDEQQARGLPMRTATIRELDETLQQLLVRRWFRVLKDDAEQAARTAGEMLEHLGERPELRELTTNPMLLTAMCVIYNQGARLPQDKHDLYEQIVDNVLYNRYRNDATELDMARQHLTVVACGMHTGLGLEQQRVTPQAESSYGDIERMIRAFHEVSPVTYEGYKNALDTRDQLLQRSGLLLSRGEKKAGFYHYTFQDFLAARRLADIQRDRLFDIFCERAETKEWRNTLSFLFSGELAGSREQATRLLNRLIERLTLESLGLAVVVADCLETMRGRDNRLRADVEQKFKTICLLAIQNEVEVKARHTLGVALGHLGDPRIIEDLRDPAAYVEIPAGDYAYQEGRQALKEPFWLSKYPVTNSQFALFIREKGYTHPGLWSEEGRKWLEQNPVVEPAYWKNSRWNAPNQPVVGVSYFEAEAFCKWAGGFLPTEQQWEAAARGKSGHDYPWGGPWEDGICNSAEAGLKMTSPVGLFPKSRSVDFELDDLSGNVWEWCDSYYSKDSKGRVLRGGSFYYLASWVRGAYRVGDNPDTRYHNYGFRVARTLPP